MADKEISGALRTITSSAGASTSLVEKIVPKLSADGADWDSGLCLLQLRPQLLLSTLHHLVILIALRTASSSPDESRLSEAILASGETTEKIRSMEGKLDYQIKKLMGLAEAKSQPEAEDPLSFRPNPQTLQVEPEAKSSAGSSTAYRPPRVAAVRYPEGESQRKARKAPALLSEFAATMNGAPGLESTSGLSTRPVEFDKRTNSVSAKRAAELKRMNDFEEENMTRLVTTKREAKRRREDEAALALGYGVVKGRGRRRNGLEAELEGVLGESRGHWDGVSQKRSKYS